MSTEIWVSGPVIDILLYGPNPLTAPAALHAIIDTGASGICLDRRIALNLGLIASNRKKMQMADGTEVDATSYRAEMYIDGLGFRDWVEVQAIEMEYPSTRVLLGRSFLKKYIVNYDGPRELFHYFNASDGPSSFYEDHDG